MGARWKLSGLEVHRLDEDIPMVTERWVCTEAATLEGPAPPVGAAEVGQRYTKEWEGSMVGDAGSLWSLSGLEVHRLHEDIPMIAERWVCVEDSVPDDDNDDNRGGNNPPGSEGVAAASAVAEVNDPIEPAAAHHGHEHVADHGESAAPETAAGNTGAEGSETPPRKKSRQS